MKRNLSSQAIRAMAIGMAVTLGSATAVSGVVTGTVVNVYAANEQVEATEAKIVKDNTDVKITLKAKTGTFTSGGSFASKTEGFTLSDGKNIFTGTAQVGSVKSTTGSAANDTLEITIPIQKLTEAQLILDGSKTFKLSYKKSGSSDVQVDSSDLTLTDLVLDGKIDTVAPTLKDANAEYNSSGGIHTVEVTLTENLANRSEQNTNGEFTVERKGTGTETITVSKHKAEQGKLVLTLDKELIADTYTITYAKEDTELKDEAGNKLTQASNNKVEVTVTAAPPVVSAPVIESNAQYAEDTKTITLTSDKELKDQNATVNKDTHGFVVKNSQKQEQTIKQVTVSGKNITIELEGKDALVGDTYTVGYTKGSSEFITTKDGAGKLDTNENLATFKVSATVNPPVSGDFTATTVDGNYTFKKIGSNDKEVALVGFTTVQTRAAQTNTFENGVLTAEGKTYTLTQIGDDSKTAITELTDKALKGHTENVTTIKEEAFKGNTNIKNVSFPKVTSVGKNAFYGATALVSIDLGSASKGITVEKDAFTGANNLKNIATSEANKTNVEAAIKGSNLQDIKVITDQNSNATNATIAAGKFYQTKEGLIFKGLSDKELSFEGKDKFTAPTKPNGLDGQSEKTAYLVTYKDGVVSLKAGENTQTPVEESFDVTVKDKKLTFKPLANGKSVALANVGNASVMRAAAVGNTLKDGVLTVGSKTYNFTQIGDGNTPLATDFDANTVLAGNLDKVTTVAKDAFKDNTALKEISLPKVTTIQEGAFNGTSNLAKVFLGDEVVTVAKDAFKGTKSDIKVSSNNDKTIENLKNSETGLDTNKVENAAPFVTSAVVNNDAKNKVIVTFSEKVYAPKTITAGNFTIESAKNSPNVSKVTGLETVKENATNTITLELSANIEAGEAPLLKYTKAGEPIKDTATKEVELANISTGFNITNNIKAGVVLPQVTEAKVENAAKDKIVLTLDQDPKQSLETSDKDNFSLKITGGTTDHKITNVETSSKTITITLDKELSVDNTEIKLSYSGNKIETLTDKVVTNNIQAQGVDVKVAEGGATANGTTLTITTDKFLKTGAPNKAGFTVTRDGGSINVASVSTNDSKNITLTLDGQGVEATHTEIKVQYQGTDLLEKDTNKVINGFTTPFVINEKDATAPTLSTATASGSQQSYTITLPVSEPIKQTADPKSKFAVTVTGAASSGKTVTVGSATIDSNTKKSITLNVTTNKALDTAQDKFQVVYTKGAELVDLKDNQLDTKTIQDITITSSRVAPILAHSDSDLVAIAKVNENQEGKVTVVNSFKGTDKDVIQSMLTKDLTKIASGAFSGISGITLDLSNISVSVIDNGAFNGASNLTVKYTGSEKEAYELAKKLENVSGVTVNDKKPSDVIKDYENNNNNNGGSGSGGGSSSGGSGGGSGANIGTITNKKPNTEETTSQVNNNNETVVENKQLSFDVIKLPSVEGEAKVFGDVSANHWAKSYIDKLSTARIINGSNGMFNPNGQTKRADVTVMLVNLLGLTPEANNKFADVNASAYYAPYVGTASTYGIVNGSNGMFNPQGVISRQDTMVMIAQILKGLNLNVNADTTALSQFGDASKVSAYANESVAILVNSGIIAGNNGKLNPTAPVTRAEMATIMSKLYDVLASANK